MPAVAARKYAESDLVHFNVRIHRDHVRAIKIMAIDEGVPVRDVVDRVLVDALGVPASAVPAKVRAPRPKTS